MLIENISYVLGKITLKVQKQNKFYKNTFISEYTHFCAVMFWDTSLEIHVPL